MGCKSLDLKDSIRLFMSYWCATLDGVNCENSKKDEKELGANQLVFSQIPVQIYLKTKLSVSHFLTELKRFLVEIFVGQGPLRFPVIEVMV